jgi:hypothetical protein
MEAYVAAKLRALAPWSEGSHTYQRVFAEAYQLCQRGSDFNLIYRESEGRFVRLFTPQSQPGNPAWLRAVVLRKWSKRRRETAGWRQLSGIVEMRPAGHLWVQEKPAWYRVVPEGRLNPNQLQTCQPLSGRGHTIWWIYGGIGVGLVACALSAWLYSVVR